MSHLAICIQVLITPSSVFAQCKALEGFFLTPLYFLKAICNYTCVLAVKMTKSFLRKVRCDFDKFTKNLFGVASEYQIFLSCHTSNCTLRLLQPRTFFTACFIIQETFYCSLSHCELKAIKHWLMRLPSARVSGSHLLYEALLSVLCLKL